jgi:hypothetical protein
MRIVDAQVHIWGANTPERPWPARLEAHRDVPIGKDELLREMDAAGADRVIIVPPSWEGDRNDLALQAAQAHPMRSVPGACSGAPIFPACRAAIGKPLRYSPRRSRGSAPRTRRGSWVVRYASGWDGRCRNIACERHA